MILTNIEKKILKKINKEINDKINYSVLEKFNDFYEEDCEYRLELINELVTLLSQEKEIIEDVCNRK
jgi:hypothetical protein